MEPPGPLLALVQTRIRQNWRYFSLFYTRLILYFPASQRKILVKEMKTKETKKKGKKKH